MAQQIVIRAKRGKPLAERWNDVLAAKALRQPTQERSLQSRERLHLGIARRSGAIVVHAEQARERHRPNQREIFVAAHPRDGHEEEAELPLNLPDAEDRERERLPLALVDGQRPR